MLLSRLPYDKSGDECFMPSIARWFNERGYAVVVQDVRGKIRSGGALAPFRSEIVDGYDTIEWITEQSWSAGPVGMFGDSYFGWTQWAAAASEHRALAAITPRVISSDIADVTTRGSLFALEVTALWAFETWVDEHLYDDESGPDWSIRPLSEVVPHALGGRRSAFLDETAQHGPPATARVPVRGDVPALHIGGWWDLAQRGQVATWNHAREQRRAPQFLVMDAVDHGWTRLRGDSEQYVDPQTSDATMHTFLDDYLGLLVPFLDHHLADGAAYDEAPVRWMLTHDSWRRADRWPPAESAPVDWFLVGHSSETDGGLSHAPETASRTLEWTQDPNDLVPSLAHAYHPLIDPADHAVLDGRSDVLRFRTEPVREPLDLAGPIEVVVPYESSSPTAKIVVSLYDVPPDGAELRIADGASPMPVGGPARVDLGSTGYRVRPGHALRLRIAASEFPRYLPDTGTGEDPWTAVDFLEIAHRITIGGAHAARLRCFVIAPTGGGA